MGSAWCLSDAHTQGTHIACPGAAPRTQRYPTDFPSAYGVIIITMYLYEYLHNIAATGVFGRSPAGGPASPETIWV